MPEEQIFFFADDVAPYRLLAPIFLSCCSLLFFFQAITSAINITMSAGLYESIMWFAFVLGTYAFYSIFSFEAKILQHLREGFWALHKDGLHELPKEQDTLNDIDDALLPTVGADVN